MGSFPALNVCGGGRGILLATGRFTGQSGRKPPAGKSLKKAVANVVAVHGVSQRRACEVLAVDRSGGQDRGQHGEVRLDRALPGADDGEPVAGHGRVLAAAMPGLKDMPVIRATHPFPIVGRQIGEVMQTIKNIGVFPQTGLRDCISNKLRFLGRCAIGKSD